MKARRANRIIGNSIEIATPHCMSEFTVMLLLLVSGFICQTSVDINIAMSSQETTRATYRCSKSIMMHFLGEE